MSIKAMLDECYSVFEGSAALNNYSERHGLTSQAVLTVYDDETADAITRNLIPRIEGRTVVEIGGGIGLLALHLGLYAKHVFCIEANPVWTSCFLAALIDNKPKNVSYLFGAADEFTGMIRADVALFCTHSGVDAMRAAGLLFAPTVIDVYAEILETAPGDFDPLALALRRIV